MEVRYNKIMFFIMIWIIALSLNLLVFHFFSIHLMLIFSMFSFAFFYYYFGIKKVKTKHELEIIFETIKYIIIFFIIYYSLGLVVGISITGNYYTVYSLHQRIVPLIMYIIFREMLRWNVFNSIDDNKIRMFLCCTFFILLDLTGNVTGSDIYSKSTALNFITLTLVPIIFKNIVYSHIIKDSGYKSIILFDLIFTLYPYVLPFVPNPNQYILSIINLIVPVLLVFRIESFLEITNKGLNRNEYYKKKVSDFFVPTLLILTFAYLFSGYFKYYAVVVASESMKPSLNKGDLVVIDQKSHNLDKSDIIAYRKGAKIIIHRINKIEKNGDDINYYTKGDNNRKNDDLIVKDDMILGKVKLRLPYVGYPTVWFNNK